MTTWRRGAHNPYTVYKTGDTELTPELDAEINCVGFFRNPDDAEKAVNAVNALAKVGDDAALSQMAIRYDALLEAAQELATNVKTDSKDALLEDYAANVLALIPSGSIDRTRQQAVERVKAFVKYLESGKAEGHHVVWAPNEGVTLRLSDLRTLLAIVPD